MCYMVFRKWEPCDYFVGAGGWLVKYFDMASKTLTLWSSHHGSAVTNLTGIHEDTGLIPGLAEWVKDPVFCPELWCRSQTRSDSELLLLWLWHKPAVAALIRPLAWELPYAASMALKGKKKKKKKRGFAVKIFITEFHLSWAGSHGGVRLRLMCCTRGSCTFYLKVWILFKSK